MAGVAGRYAQTIESLYAQLRERFAQAGWAVAVEPPGGPPGYCADLLVEKGALRYVAELRVAKESRQNELLGLLADAWLRASAGARTHGARPLAVVGAPYISAAAARSLENYAARFLPEGSWGLIDATGKLELNGPGLAGLSTQGEPIERSPVPSAPASPFSDLGQWLLKVLLAPSLPPDLIAAPRGRFRSARELGTVAGISAPSAARLVSHLRAHDYVDARRLEVVRVQELLEGWRASMLHRNELEFRCRWLLPPRESASHLVKRLERYANGRIADGRWNAGPRACLGLFAACDRMRLGVVRGVADHLYVEAPESLAELGLVAAREGEVADVLVRIPRFPESVFRAAVVRDGVPTADVLQCWLDVSHHPSRGAEQADFLFRRVLAPAFGLSG